VSISNHPDHRYVQVNAMMDVWISTRVEDCHARRSLARNDRSCGEDYHARCHFKAVFTAARAEGSQGV